MKGFLANPLINVLAAVVGGILLGFGIGRVFHTPTVGAGVATVREVVGMGLLAPFPSRGTAVLREGSAKAAALFRFLPPLREARQD
jgi:hypothetical protein